MITYIHNLIVWILLFICSSPFMMAEKTPFFFTQIGNENGLTENTITYLFQDTESYIWIGTRNGLFQYDGSNCTIYRSRPGQSHSLGDNSVSCIEEDSQGGLWIITSHHVQKLDRQTRHIQQYSMEKSRFMHFCKQRKNGECWFVGEQELYIYDPKTDSLIWQPDLSPLPFHSNVCAMREDKNGNLYIVSRNSGILVVDAEKKIKHHYTHNPDDPTSLISGTLSDLYIDSHDRVWVTSLHHGVCVLDPVTQTFKRLDHENAGLANNAIRCITEYAPDQFLVGSFSGLSQIDGRTYQIRNFDFNPEDAGSLGHYSIHCFLKDNTRGLWVGTWNGLNYYNPMQKQINTVTPQGFTGVLGRGEEDDNGNIWFVTEGAGLLCYNPKVQTQQTFAPNPTQGYNQNILKSLCVRGDSIFCATNQGCVYLFSRRQKRFKQLYDFKGGDIYYIYLDSQNRLWIPTNSAYGLVLIDNGKQTNLFPVDGKRQPIRFVTTIKELSPQRFLFGTLMQELYLYDIEKDSVTHFALGDLSQSPRNGEVTGIESCPDGSIYVSTFGNGFFVFDNDLQLQRHYINQDGLRAAYIYTLIQDYNHTLWILGEDRLYYKKQRQSHFHYMNQPKFSKHNYTFRGATLDSHGTLYFPSNHNILCFHPQEKDSIPLPPIYLTGISVNNRNLSFTSDSILTLPFNETNLAITYTAPNFIEPENIQYRYRMNGVDENFNTVGNRTIAYYSHLLAGDYTFQVQVGNSDGQWNPQTATLSIRVLPPFYKTPIAYLLYILFIGLILYGIIHYFNVRNKLENDIRYKQMEEDKIKAINEERIRLFTNFSHELRTPLTLISTPLEDLLQNKVFSTEVKKVLLLMQKNIRKILLLVNNLMDIQKYDAHKITLQKETFNLSEFIQEIFEMFESIAKKRNIIFTLDNKIPESYNVYYDKQEFEKVLFNLLSNAFKFTPESGHIILRLSSVVGKNTTTLVPDNLVTQLVEDYYLHIEVIDDGIGIAPNELETIFQRFHQSTQDLHHQIAGSGIGLSLVHFIVEQHQGVIWTRSSQNTGTEMHILFPLLNNPSHSPQMSQSYKKQEKNPVSLDNLQPVSTQQATLLFVEDNVDVLHYLDSQFNQQYNILKAQNGKEALSLLELHKVHLIVSDIMMPQMDGLELCQRIKHSTQWGHLPVILLTAKTLPEQISEGYNAGADDYIAKPYDIHLLRKRIHNLLKNREQIQKKFEKELKLESFGIQTEKDQSFFTQYTNLIKANFSNPDFNIDDICKELGISRANFYRKVKTQTGLSPAEMLRKLRLEVAAQMLRETELSIAEIQTKVAFSNSGYFASCFKQVYGMSPKEYRNANKM